MRIWSPDGTQEANVDDPEQLKQALAAGWGPEAGSEIGIAAPDGSRYNIPANKLALALDRGFTPETYEQSIERTHGGNNMGALGAAFARGATMGISDAVMTNLGLVNSETLDLLEKANPVASGVGEVAGVLSPFNPLGKVKAAGGLFKAVTSPSRLVSGVGAHVTASTEAKLLEFLTKRGADPGLLAKTLSKGGGYAAGGAAEGGMLAVGEAISETALGRTETVGEALAANIGPMAIAGGIAGGIFGSGTYLGGRALSRATHEVRKKLSPAIQGEIGRQEDLVFEVLGINPAKVFKGDDALKNNVRSILSDIGITPGMKQSEAALKLDNHADILRQRLEAAYKRADELGFEHKPKVKFDETVAGRKWGPEKTELEGPSASRAEEFFAGQRKAVQEADTVAGAEFAPTSVDEVLPQSGPSGTNAGRPNAKAPRQSSEPDAPRGERLEFTASEAGAPIHGFKRPRRGPGDAAQDSTQIVHPDFEVVGSEISDIARRLEAKWAQHAHGNAAAREMDRLAQFFAKKGPMSFQEAWEARKQLGQAWMGEAREGSAKAANQELYIEFRDLLMGRVKNVLSKYDGADAAKMFQQSNDDMSAMLKFLDDIPAESPASWMKDMQMPLNILLGRKWAAGQGGAAAAMLAGGDPILGAALGMASKAVYNRISLEKRIAMLNAIRKSVIQLDRRITKAVRGFAKPGSLPTNVALASSGILATLTGIDDPKKAAKKLALDLHQHAVAPERLTDNISGSLADLDEVAPSLSQKVTATTVNAVMALQQVMPTPPPEALLRGTDKGWEISDYEAEMVQIAAAAAADPISVIEEAARGIAHPLAIQLVKTAYPDLLKTVQSQVVEVMGEGDGDLSNTTRTQLAQLFGVTLDKLAEPGAISRSQAAYEQPANPGQGPGGVRLSGLGAMQGMGKFWQPTEPMGGRMT